VLKNVKKGSQLLSYFTMNLGGLTYSQDLYQRLFQGRLFSGVRKRVKTFDILQLNVVSAEGTRIKNWTQKQRSIESSHYLGKLNLPKQ
jgi:hypothetical protein